MGQMPEEISVKKNERLILLLSVLTGILVGSSMSWFSIYSGSLQALSLFFGLLFLAVSFYEPLWGLLILMGLFLSPWLFHSAEITSFEVYWGILFLAGFSGAFLKAVLKRKQLLVSYRKEPLLWVTLLFLVWGIISLLVTLKEGERFIWWLRKYLDFMGYFLIFWMVWSISKKNENWIKILLGLFLCIGIVKGFQQIIYYYQHFSEAIALNNLQIVRKGAYAEFFGSPGFILALCFYIYGKKLRQKLFFGSLTLFFLFLLILSFTRSMWMGFAASFLCLLIGFRVLRARILKAVLVLFGFTAALLVGGFFWEKEVIIYLSEWIGARFLSYFGFESQLSVMDRFAEWQGLWNQAWKKPLMGHGIGEAFTFYSVNPWSWMREGGLGRVTIRYSHNTYLYIFYTMGIVGLVLFALMIFSVLKETWKIWNKSKDSFSRAYCSAVYSILIGFLVTGITCPVFIGKTSSIYLGLLMGIVAVLNRKVESEKID